MILIIIIIIIHRRSVTSSGYITGCGSCSGESSITEDEQIRGPSDNTSFVPIAFKISGCFNKTGLEFITELGNRLKLVTGDNLELTYLFQRLSIAIQRDNELCFNGTFVPR